MAGNVSERVGGWRPHLTWPVLLLVGWALYEATAQPGLAAAIACAKAGWADFRAAFWLRRVDPERGRGRACFWFYLAFGLWKVAVLASAMMFALIYASVLLANAGPRMGGQVRSSILGVLVAAGIGFGLSSLSTYIALWSAHRHRIKVWLGFAPYRARADRFWPPCHGHFNAAPFVAVTTLVLIPLILFTALLLPVLLIGRRLEVSLVLLVLCALVVGSGLVLFIRLVDRHAFAQEPRDCWPPGNDDVIYESAERDEVL
jgi:hypothetical protein